MVRATFRTLSNARALSPNSSIACFIRLWLGPSRWQCFSISGLLIVALAVVLLLPKRSRWMPIAASVCLRIVAESVPLCVLVRSRYVTAGTSR
jgi:hypothetical protein